MKAMIFAAGIGSRLRPVTYEKPKAMVKVGGKTMLEHALEHLSGYGCKDIIINLHHFPEQIKNFVEENINTDVNIIFSEEKDLLDTGGGLKKASWFFDDEPFLVYNVDILSNLNLNALINFHNIHYGLASVVVRRRNSSRYLLIDNDDKLTGWEDTRKKSKKMILKADSYERYAFSGIHVLSPEIIPLFPHKDKFSIIDFYLEVIKSHSVYAFLDDDSYWFDIGDLEKLKKANEFMGRRE
ncbi:MAG: nucleotidyltransferase family protein [Bacteroidales bacterium]